jgi:hypothetical protein
MLTTLLCHPLGARQVALPGASGPLGLLQRIDTQHDARDVGPHRTIGLGVEKAKIGDKVLPVVVDKNIGIGSPVGNRLIMSVLAYAISASCGQPHATVV